LLPKELLLSVLLKIYTGITMTRQECLFYKKKKIKEEILRFAQNDKKVEGAYFAPEGTPCVSFP